MNSAQASRRAQTRLWGRCSKPASRSRPHVPSDHVCRCALFHWCSATEAICSTAGQAATQLQRFACSRQLTHPALLLTASQCCQSKWVALAGRRLLSRGKAWAASTACRPGSVGAHVAAANERISAGLALNSDASVQVDRAVRQEAPHKGDTAQLVKPPSRLSRRSLAAGAALPADHVVCPATADDGCMYKGPWVLTSIPVCTCATLWVVDERPS